MRVNITQQVTGPILKVRHILSCYISPCVDLIIRLWIAQVFFTSGLTKIRNWEHTVFLFEFEYAVPVLPPEIAALFAAAFELVMPVLLVFGLFARLAAVPLLAMALVIQFVVAAHNASYHNVEHFYWMMLLLVIIAKGPGMISLDHLICRKFCDGGK